jgi:hypothetical protein
MNVPRDHSSDVAPGWHVGTTILYHTALRRCLSGAVRIKQATHLGLRRDLAFTSSVLQSALHFLCMSCCYLLTGSGLTYITAPVYKLRRAANNLNSPNRSTSSLMASLWTRRARNLPAQQSEINALEALLREDLEDKSMIESRQKALQGRISEAESSAKAIFQCITATDALKAGYAENFSAVKAFEERIIRALEMHSCHSKVLAGMPSTGELLATWSNILRLIDELSPCLERAKLQAEAHLHLCAVEQVAHESAAAAAKQSLRGMGGRLNRLKSSISQKRKKIYSIRCLPTELIYQIFKILVEEKQASLNRRLYSFQSLPKAYCTDPKAMWKTINFVPIILSAVCTRWRDICESTPGLWRFLRIPTTLRPDLNPLVIGGLPFARAIANTDGQNLEITLYPSLEAETVAQALSHIPSECSIALLNVIEGVEIPSTLSSALIVVFIGHSDGSEVNAVELVPTRLENAHQVWCLERLPSIQNGPLLLSMLSITLTKSCTFPDIGQLLVGLPALQILRLWFCARITHQASTACTHHHLHTISVTSCALNILQSSIRDGVSIPVLRHFELLDVDETFACLNVENNAATFALVTRLTLNAASSQRASVKIRTLLDAMTALLTLELTGTAVGPGLNALTIAPVVVRIPKITLEDSDANCEPLDAYLANLAEELQAINDDRSLRVTWKNCPGFLARYGASSGVKTLTKSTKSVT